jgi:hypothetical protein
MRTSTAKSSARQQLVEEALRRFADEVLRNMERESISRRPHMRA